MCLDFLNGVDRLDLHDLKPVGATVAASIENVALVKVIGWGNADSVLSAHDLYAFRGFISGHSLFNSTLSGGPGLRCQ